MIVNQRVQKLQQRILDEGLSTLLITQPENCCYLSGITDGAGVILLISPDNAVLATDFIHLEQTQRDVTGFEIIRLKNKPEGRFTELISGRGIKFLGFEADTLCFTDYRRLAEESKELRIQLIPMEGLVDSLRAVKESEELKSIMKAAELADAAWEYIAREIRPGVTEKELAWKIESFLRERGSEHLPFDIIVASGPNAALPHARPTERPLSVGEPVVFDLGARVKGYASDLSRTICLGSGDETFIKIYRLVQQAQLAAIAGVKIGLTGKQVDNLAREVINQGGYQEAFGHGLGHGVGLATHEKPTIGPNSTNIIAENMVFTIEPGIYISGWGGVRLEDMVMIENGKTKILTKVSK